jgi:hypothetical protein
MSFSVSVDAERLKNLSKNLPKLPKWVIKVGLEAVAEQMEKDKQSLKPGAVKYPIQWTSEKQRRAYFATDGFSKPKGWERPKGYVNQNVPYRRTGNMINDIHFKYGEGGGSDYVTAETDSPYAQFVVGQYQQKFHHNTGWRTLETWMTSNRRKVMGVFRDATTKAVKEFNRWMYGGAPGV